MDIPVPPFEESAAEKRGLQSARREGTGGGVRGLISHLEDAGRSPRTQAVHRKGRGPVSGGETLARGLSVMKSPIDGLGCFATVRFPKDGLIAEYVGELINYQEAMRRMKGPGRICISELDTDCYIDGSVGGNGTQYINHSCEPNAYALIIEGFMFVFALQEIASGEEITVDYLNTFEEDRTVCRCRSVSCRQGISQEVA